jgi:hypothetical protein
MAAWKLYKNNYVDPIFNAAKTIYDVISKNWQRVFDSITTPLFNR